MYISVQGTDTMTDQFCAAAKTTVVCFGKQKKKQKTNKSRKQLFSNEVSVVEQKFKQ